MRRRLQHNLLSEPRVCWIPGEPDVQCLCYASCLLLSSSTQLCIPNVMIRKSFGFGQEQAWPVRSHVNQDSFHLYTNETKRAPLGPRAWDSSGFEQDHFTNRMTYGHTHTRYDYAYSKMYSIVYNCTASG